MIAPNPSPLADIKQKMCHIPGLHDALFDSEKKGFIVPAWGPDNEANCKNLYPPLLHPNHARSHGNLEY